MLVVAGGGGGGGNASAFGVGGNGGNAGMPGGSGQAGSAGTGSQSGGGGGGGNQNSGGPTGSIGACSQLRWDGSFRQGGFSGVDSFSQAGGAGGGSGLFGGGSGGRSCNSTGAGGGGGGSSYITPSATNTSSSLDTTLHPFVSITPVAVATTTSLQLAASQVGTGQSIGLDATVTPVPSGGLVDFTANNGTSTVDLGTASVDTTTGHATKSPTLSAGQWQVTAAYQGYTPYTASTSASKHLQVGTVPTVTLNPVNATATAAGTSGTEPIFNSVSFTATGTGDPAPTIQWQRQISGTSHWFNVTNETGTTFTYTPILLQENGDQYRAEFTNPAGKVDSNPAVLTLLSGPQAELFPQITRVFDGNPVQLQGLAIANPLATGTWEMSTNGGGTWGPVTSAFHPQTEAYVPSNNKTDDWLDFSATLAMNGYQFRIRYTNQVDTGTAAGTGTEVSYTSPVFLDGMSVDITYGFPPQHCQQVPDRTQPLSPTNHYVCDGADLRGLFLEGLPAAYGSFRGTNFAGDDLSHTAFPWADVTGANFTGASLEFGGFGGFGGVPATNAAIMSDPITHSNPANLSNADLKHSTQNYADFTGVDITGANFTDASVIGTIFTHTAVMPPDVTIYSANPVTPTDAAAGTYQGPSPVTGLFLGGCALGGEWSTAANPNPISCLVYDPSVIGQGSGDMYVTVLPLAPSVTTDPQDATVDYGNPAPHSATFTAAANGAPPLTVRWQVSSDNGAHFTDVQDATATTLTVTDPPVDANPYGTLYRAVFSNSEGTATTTAARLHVYPAPPTPIFVFVSGRQTFGDTTATFTEVASPPTGVTLSGTPSCTDVFVPGLPSQPIDAALPVGSYYIDGGSCGGVTASGPDTYDVIYLSDGPQAFAVDPVKIVVDVSGTMEVNGAPTFTETDNAPNGITVPAPVLCAKLSDGTPIDADTPIGTYTVGGPSCSTPPLPNPNYTLVFHGVTDGFTVTPPTVHVHVFAVQTYGGTPEFKDAPEPVPGVDVTGTLSCTGALPPTKAVGGYAMSGVSCSGQSASVPSYVIGYV